ncbi:MAG: hypothetical protein LWW85_15420 [Marinilabiliales bacterium]|nr:hypothetical protein [Marinilabiliales bacterium]
MNDMNREEDQPSLPNKSLTETTKVRQLSSLMTIYQMEDSYALWFHNSHRFVLVEEPVHDVIQQFHKRLNKTEIYKILRSKYKDPKFELHAFIKETFYILRQLNKKVRTVSKTEEIEKVAPPLAYDFSHCYRLGKKVIKIDYQEVQLHRLIHPTLFPLETFHPAKIHHTIQCFAAQNLLCATLDHKMREIFDLQEMEYFKGAISLRLYSLLYKYPITGWMCTLHASGVSLNNQAVIFSAAAGSGKSTVAAILKAHGFEYIADDFIATSPTGNVYPFPSAISVKEGSFKTLKPFYPDLKSKTPVRTTSGKMVRYLPVQDISNRYKTGIPVKCIVFVHYDAGSGLSMSRINKKMALQRLLEETWINPKPAMVAAFFDWIERMPFYQISYSDQEEMVSVVKKILSDEA